MADSAHILPMRRPMGMVPATPIWCLGKHGLRLPLRLHVDDENMTDPKPPTEIKVPQAAAGGAGLGALSQLIVWVLGCWVWGASWDADKVTTAIAAVPSPVSIVIGIAFTYVGAYYFGWRAPHTHRPDLVDETLPIIKPVAIDDQVTAQLDKMEAHLDQLHADLQHTGPIHELDAMLGDPAHD